MRAMHVKVNKKKGIQNWLEHTDGSVVCIPGEWDVTMTVPYPSNKSLWPSNQMLQRWEHVIEVSNA